MFNRKISIISFGANIQQTSSTIVDIYLMTQI
uniref:Uncharacterized protein n=1 Tax=Lepeophtheirus salmonis TaxID=72036 RepID=A0A0K2T082_LEPSM